MRRRTVFTATAAAVGTSVLGTAHTATAHPAAAGVTSSSGVVISQIISRAQNVDSGIANAAEIANPSASPASIGNWQIIFYDSGNTPAARLPFDPGTEVPPLGFIVVKDPDFMPVPVDPRLLLPGRMFNYTLMPGSSDGLPDAGGVALFDDNGTRVDGVATTTGATNALEGSPAPRLHAGTDLWHLSLRRDRWLTDTDNNAVDFQLRPAVWGSVLD